MQVSIPDLVNPILFIFYDLIQMALDLWDTFMSFLLPFLQMIPLPFAVPWSNVVATVLFMFVLGMVFAITKRSTSDGEEEIQLPIPSEGEGSRAMPGDIITSFIVRRKRDLEPEVAQKIIEQETSSALSAISAAKKENRISGPIATELEKRFLLRLKNLKKDLEITVPSHEEDRLLDELSKLKAKAQEREEEVRILQARVKEITQTEAPSGAAKVSAKPSSPVVTEPTPKTPIVPKPKPVGDQPLPPVPPVPPAKPQGDTSGEALIAEMLSAIQTITKEFKSEQT